MIPSEVLGKYRPFIDGKIRPFGTGLINKTYLVETGERRAIFQRLHPVFAGSVNEDIDVVTRHLAAKGLETPLLIRADDGAASVADPTDGRPWRALTYVDGESVDRVDRPARAYAGAAFVARFHRAVADLDYAYVHVRAGVHETERHLVSLDDALRTHREHRLFGAVEPVAQEILQRGARLPRFSSLPSRHCHGDLKISNVLFAPGDADRAVCLVDLDTLGRMAWPFEMGDALRSWTNPAGEDVERAAVDAAIFEAAVRGYASEAPSALTSAERETLVDGLYAICVELAARFCADALIEAYFGWSSTRFSSRGEHNLVRARGQLALARSVDTERRTLSRIVAAAFR